MSNDPIELYYFMLYQENGKIIYPKSDHLMGHTNSITRYEVLPDGRFFIKHERLPRVQPLNKNILDNMTIDGGKVFYHVKPKCE